MLNKIEFYGREDVRQYVMDYIDIEAWTTYLMISGYHVVMFFVIQQEILKELKLYTA
jgi:hypothetical protein